MIYIPGLDGTGELFFKQIGYLRDSYRVVSFRSREAGSFTYEDLANDLSAIIRDLGEARATILGESFGGTVALNFALRYPEMVERLVVINSFPRFRSRLKIKLAVRLASGLPFRLLWPLRKVSNTIGLLIDGVRAEERRMFWKAIRTVSAEGYSRRLQLISELDVVDRLGEIQSPSLFIAGERDLLVPSAKEALAMAARMPHATVKIVRGAGHACLLGEYVNLAQLLGD